MEKRVLLGFLVSLLLIGVVVFLLAINSNYTQKEMKDGSPISPMKLDLSISNPPPLGETAELTATVTYIEGEVKQNRSGVAEIILPEGLELVSGEARWAGKVEPEINFSVVVRSVKIGNWTIEGISRTPPTGETWMGGRDFIYLSVTENGSFISKKRFKEPRECPHGFNCGTSEPP